MTIKELEERLGLPRASIRFYEQEGFIRPARGENNYRDYSEEDLATLEKVKLLRQLGLSLEDIRRAQRGERPLGALLAQQEAALARQRADLDWAGQVCRAMREDGVDFATLDAPRYLDRLNRPADQPGFFDLRADAAPDIRALLPTRTQSAGAYAPVPHGIYPPSASAPCSAPTAPAGGESAPVYVESEEVTDTPPREKTKADMQREQIIRALRRNNGRRREAAAELFMSERTLYRKIKELGIEDY